MIGKIKKKLYFPLASYFRFFAGIRLKRWNPKIVVVTGSNGKTTLLHMIESQIGEKARYSHHANSSFGIPFDILDLHRKSLLKSEWINLFLKAPLQIFKSLPKEKLYIVEADCDRPGEGKFLASFLKPVIVLWISTAKTHSMNFEHLVVQTRHPRANGDSGDVDSRFRGNDNNGKFPTVEEAIAYEFGYFLQYAKELVLIDGESELMVKQMDRTKVRIVEIKKEKSLKSYDVSKKGTRFQIVRDTRGTHDTLDTFIFKFLLPEEIFYSIEMTRKLCEALSISFDQSFARFVVPPGRGSIFQGIKNITIVDSSYNSNFSSVRAIVSMFARFKEKNKWVVIGDMLELGKEEENEHLRLAAELAKYDFKKIILMGPRVGKYTYPKLLSLRALAKQSPKDRHAFQTRDDKDEGIVKFEGPKETLDYLLENIKGGDTILFKGARFMEGIIEHLLENKNDVSKLARREEVWQIRRKQWGL